MSNDGLVSSKTPASSRSSVASRPDTSTGNWMRSAIVVSTARTPIGKAYRAAFNDTQAQALGGHVIAEAARRAGIDPAEVGLRTVRYFARCAGCLCSSVAAAYRRGAGE